MTVQGLQQLSFDGLLQAAKQTAYLTSREEGKFIIFLYQLEGSYIKVYYHRKYSYIYGNRAFADTEELQPYLNCCPLDLWQ